MMFLKATSLILLALLTSTKADNPSGNCTDTTGNNGARLGYHVPSSTDTYLPDCQNSLQRELWRVFEQADGTAYVIPRPDGLGLVYGLCQESAIGTMANAAAREWGLCQTNVTNPDRVNSMDPVDALVLTNAFHRQLKFQALTGENGTASLDPLAPDEDILDACDLLPETSPAQDYCESIANRCEGDACLDVAIVPTISQARAVALALNALYGIPEVGETCVPAEWGESIFGCPVADCADPPAGCEYANGHYSINEAGDCCEKHCHAVDPLTGLSCGTEVELCNPVAYGTDQVLCPVADCDVSPLGCKLQQGVYAVDVVGNCCERQCIFVDDKGQECNYDVDANLVEQTEAVETLCTPTGNEACAVARCAAPPEGCNYKFDHYVAFEGGTCCPKLCYAVDSNGEECSFDITTTTTEEADANDSVIEEGDLCTPTGDELCPVASCMAPPNGCEFKFDRYVMNGMGRCCPALCYAEDSDGNECVSGQEEDTEPAPYVPPTGDDPFAEAPDEDEAVLSAVEERCVPNGDEACPVAKCWAKPEGCRYITDHYIMTESGKCCPKQCYSVDADGNTCAPEQPNQESAPSAGDIQIQEEDQCVPDEESTTSSMARQGSVPFNKCPMAGCLAPAPEGCTFVDGPYAINSQGDCCRKLCYAVDSQGSRCIPEQASKESTPAGGDIQVKEEDQCTPEEEHSTSTSQGVTPFNKCPMAGCAPAPAGCTYMDGPYALNSQGDCCPKLCYAVDSQGKRCGEDASNAESNGAELASGNSTEYHWLVGSLLTLGHLFFGS